MTESPSLQSLGRRHFLRCVAAGSAATAVAAPLTPAAADSENDNEKRKPRYRADAPDVQAFYRVNRYPPK
jgi:hypothetical protein